MKRYGGRQGGWLSAAMVFLGLIAAGCKTASPPELTVAETRPRSDAIVQASYQSREDPPGQVVQAGGAPSCPFG